MVIEGDKREFIRYNCNLSGTVELENKDIQRVTIRDFSREGLRLILHNSQLSIGLNLKIKVDLPGKEKPTVIAGKIVWNKYRGDISELGVRIDYMDENAINDIFNYVYECWSNKE